MTGYVQRNRIRQPRLVQDQRGAIMVMAVFFAVFLVALLFAVVGTGRAIFMREHLQDTIDGAVLSGAILNAQAMNLIVLANIVMASLLAVLIALKAVEGLCIIAIAICIAAAWFTAGASTAVIPALNIIRSDTKEIHDAVKEYIYPAIEGLHGLSDDIKDITSELAKGGAEVRLLESSVYPADHGMVFGKSTSLPVDDDNYSKLCGEAGKIVCDLVTKPFSDITDKLDKAHVSIKSLCGAFAESLSMWFCEDSSNGKASEYPIDNKRELLFPRLPEQQKCEENREKTACEWLARAEPDEQTGRCQFQSRSQCDAYEAFVSAARVQCDPALSPKPEKYTYQVHEAQVVYEWNGRQWVRGTPTNETWFAVLKDKDPPCVLDKNKKHSIGVGYKTTVHPDANNPDYVEPLCSNEEPPEVEHGLVKGMLSAPIRFKEVTQLLGCAKTESHPIPIERGDDSKTGGGPAERRPKKLAENAKLGDENFILRLIAAKHPADDRVKQIVDVARWGKTDEGDGPANIDWANGYGYAEAEYYYDGSIKEEWLWNMKWKARLRRFAPPKDTELLVTMGAICTEKLGLDCDRLIAEYLYGGLAAH